VYPASGKTVSMPLETSSPVNLRASQRDYETVGYVIKGRAELHIEADDFAGAWGLLGSAKRSLSYI